MNFEEEKYPTLPSYDDHSHSRDSHENIHEERKRLISAVSELDKIKSEMEELIRQEYEDKLQKVEEERKEKEELKNLFKENYATKGRCFNINFKDEILITLLPICNDSTTCSSPSFYFIITNKNVYAVLNGDDSRTYNMPKSLSSLGYGYFYPLYKFDKELTLDDSKKIILLFKNEVLEKQSVMYTLNLINKLTLADNIIKLFPGSYNYDLYWEKIGNSIFLLDNVCFYNKKDNVTSSIPPIKMEW